MLGGDLEGVCGTVCHHQLLPGVLLGVCLEVGSDRRIHAFKHSSRRADVHQHLQHVTLAQSEPPLDAQEQRDA